MKRSHLILIGGAEDKTGSKEVLSKTIKITRAKSVAVIPTASSYPRDVFNDYYYAFRDLGLKEIECLDIRYLEEADQEKYLEIVSKVDLVFFSGGDQVKLVNTLKGSKLLNIIKERFFQGNLPIAGTSAGAAASSDFMLYDGDYRGFNKGTVSFADGFGLIENITVDTHFLHRERIPRLVQVLMNSANKNTRGIGLDEDTAVVIAPNLRFLVIGSGMVTVINTEHITYSDYQSIESGINYSANNIRIGFLSPGTQFSTKRWSILKSNEIKKKYFEINNEQNTYSTVFIN